MTTLAPEWEALGAELEEVERWAEAEGRPERATWPALARAIRAMGGINGLGDISRVDIPGGLWRRRGGCGYDELPLALAALDWPEFADMDGEELISELWRHWDAWQEHQAWRPEAPADVAPTVASPDPEPEPDAADVEAAEVAELFGAVGEDAPVAPPIPGPLAGKILPLPTAPKQRLSPTGFGPRDSELRRQVREAADRGRVTRSEMADYEAWEREQREGPRPARPAARPRRTAAPRPGPAPRPRLRIADPAVQVRPAAWPLRGRRRRRAVSPRFVFQAGLVAGWLASLLLIALLIAAVAGAPVPAAVAVPLLLLPPAMGGILAALPIRPAAPPRSARQPARRIA